MAGVRDSLRLVTILDRRALQLSFRGSVEAFDVARDPIADVLNLVEDPFTSVADAAERLSQLERRLCALEDRRAVFLAIYLRMTERVRSGLAAGRFTDPKWMKEYLLTFADYYRRSFQHYERGEYWAVPDPWRIAYGTAVRGTGLVLQDAFLGVNAHINYDLALAINDVGIDPNRRAKYEDHRQIDQILADLVNVQQEMLADLYAPGLSDIDASLGRLDELLTLRSMTQGREHAWLVAVVLTDANWKPIHRAAQWILRTMATGGAFFMTGPSLDPTLHATLRRIEQDRLDLQDLLDRFHARSTTEA